MSEDSPSNRRPPYPIFNGHNSDEDKHYEFGFRLPSPQPVPQPMDLDGSSGPIQFPAVQSNGAVDEGPLEVASEKRLKLNDGKVKRKIRKLAQVEDKRSDAKIRKERRFFDSLFGWRMLVVCAITALVAASFGILTDEQFYSDFYGRYKRQYQLLLYGAEDYCTQRLDFSNVTAALEQRLVGQRDAIRQISQFFEANRDSQYSSLALLGPVGVGKSLTASVIADNFQWHSNVYRFFWDLLAPPGKQFANFQVYMHSFRAEKAESVDPRCGHNLLIIDHVRAADFAVLNRIDQRLSMTARKDGLRLTAIFVFQGASLADPTMIERLSESVERVYLRELDEHDLSECIQLEAKELGLDVDDDKNSFLKMMSNIEVRRYGCKPVRAKVNFYSRL